MRLRSLALASKVSGGGGGSAKTEPITITTNGVYTPSENVDGFSEVVVNTIEVPSELLNITGELSDNMDKFLLPYVAEHMRTYDITSCYQGFKDYKGEAIPFDINITDDISKIYNNVLEMREMFYYCENLKSLPKINIPSTLMNNENFTINGSHGTFNNCSSLEEIPDNWIDGTKCGSNSTNYNFANTFRYCQNLKRLPQWWYDIPYRDDLTASYQGTFYSCYYLKEIFIPIFKKVAQMNNPCYLCSMADTIIFKTQEDGSPYEVNWSNRNFTLTDWVGYINAVQYDKKGYPVVNSAETYEQYKNQDYMTEKPEYSHYNKLSAERTISTLPDASAYLASNGGTNTIKFKNNQGSATDGGAINAENLAASIAEATAKGWTVAFS